VPAARTAVIDEIGAGNLDDELVEVQRVESLDLLDVEGGESRGQILRADLASFGGGHEDLFGDNRGLLFLPGSLFLLF
jgi:hypothetical protein